MIVAFSTSSPWSSVAAIDGSTVLWQAQRHAPQQASNACLAMLQEMEAALGRGVADASGFAADIGPGSFTGVRVGVMLAKTFAFVHGKSVVGADSFDLIDPTGVVVLPSKRGEYFVRTPGEIAVRSEVLPEGEYRGFGPDVDPSEPPHAAGFSRLLETLVPEDPNVFAPRYLIEPSISTPKKPFRGVNA